MLRHTLLVSLVYLTVLETCSFGEIVTRGRRSDTSGGSAATKDVLAGDGSSSGSSNGDIMDNLKGFIPKHDKDSDKDESDEDLSDEDDDDSSDNDQMDWASIFGGFSDKYMNGTNSQGFNEQDSTNQTQQDQQNGTISQAFAKFFKG
ncbi:uncharacterized protein LOC110441693 isoform X2 [Mizuhopecten yessoensis]|uniref:uncharacterized protein LOC110441693 isoform X2 n=1 Tax=Mizuhopecten yessoensis TaxID=6573 RepID=UPI000B45DA17|nr:uncharacterized protein LOC110441693 isoform X2 [Mizuhopecten yessoensis]